jgi:hypothetical protein
MAFAYEFDKFFFLTPSSIAKHHSLSPSAKLTYGVMLSLSTKTGYCFASHERIALHVNISQRSVTRAITELHRHGCIAPYVRPNGEQAFIQGGFGDGWSKAWVCLIKIERRRRSKLISMPTRAGQA